MTNYKLTYFNGRGRAELSRLIFAAAGAQFTDERLTNWPTGKEDSPLGQLPYLTVDGVKLPQSLSVGRFLAKQFNLAGADNLTQAKADAIVDTLNDVLGPFYGKVAFAKENKVINCDLICLVYEKLKVYFFRKKLLKRLWKKQQSQY
jgi:glutathione S-transferase